MSHLIRTLSLKLFESNGFLKHHKVVNRAYRRAIFDQHWSGQIEEIKSGERWIVDSWFQNNGNLPYVQKAELWEGISLFTSILDNSQGKPKKRSWLKKVFN